MTTRVSTRYRTRLEVLRASILALTEDTTRDVLLGQLDDLAYLVAMGFAPTEEVEVEPASLGDLVVIEDLEARRDADGITGLLDDTESMTSGLRDNRLQEAG